MKANKSPEAVISFCKKNKMQVIIIVCALFALLILSGSDFFVSSPTKQTDTTKEVYTLESELEKRLEGFLKSVDGVGKVKICITFDLLEETEYAKNVDADSEECSSEYIIVENADGSEGGLALRIRTPRVRGVAVACEGASSAKVRNEVTALLTSCLGISANRVHVATYSENN